jgi:hypothetical protein
MKRRVLWTAGLWVLSASVATVVAWWQESSLANLRWPGIDFVASGKCVRLTLFERLQNDALSVFNASLIWIMVGTWVLALILALIVGWIARPSTSFRGALRLLAICLALYALVITVGLLLTHIYSSFAQSDPYATTTYPQLVASAFILLIGPSAVLFFASWLVRGLVLGRGRGIDPDSLPAEPAT